VARHDLPQCPLQPPNIELAPEPPNARHVVRAVGHTQLVDQPQPLLRKRHTTAATTTSDEFRLVLPNLLDEGEQLGFGELGRVVAAHPSTAIRSRAATC